MERNRLYRTEAIVLKGLNYGEADRILSLFTPHLGKVRVVAKGVRKTRSRKSGHLDLFTRSNVMIARGRQLDIVTQAETIESFGQMRADLWRSSYCHYVAELVDQFSPDHLVNRDLYNLTLNCLRRLNSASGTELALRSFELQLLGITGYQPQLHRCLHCNAVIEPVANRFSSRQGGVLCPNCVSADPGSLPISPNALKVLRNLQTNEEGVMQVSKLDQQVSREVEGHLQEYIVHHLEHRPRSINVLKSLRAQVTEA